MWIDDLFDDNVKTQEVIYPFTTQALNDVLRGLKETLHGNFIASFLAVGRFIIFITKFSHYYYYHYYYQLLASVTISLRSLPF